MRGVDCILEGIEWNCFALRVVQSSRKQLEQSLEMLLELEREDISSLSFSLYFTSRDGACDPSHPMQLYPLWS